MSLHAVVVPAFLQTLKGLSDVLAKAEAHCEAKKIAPEALLSARLFPDMYPLTRQVQAACDAAARACARLAGVDVPAYPDEEKSFAELQKRIETVSSYLKGFTEQQFEGAATRDISVPAGPRTLNFKGAQFLATFAFPNFYFHATTAYDILRHNGIEIGKRDFLGMS
jgi:uncharacterized protein